MKPNAMQTPLQEQEQQQQEEDKGVWQEDCRNGNEGASTSSCILMVQRLIEHCLLLHMGREDIVDALRTHARLNPSITLLVWQELEKANSKFFKDYEEAKTCIDKDLVISMWRSASNCHTSPWPEVSNSTLEEGSDSTSTSSISSSIN